MMKVKVSNIFMGLFGAFLLNACSSDEVLPDNNPVVDGENSRFMAVTIRNVNDVMSRGGGDQAGNLFEEGLDPENKVNTLRFYFFKSDGTACPVKLDGTNYYDCKKDEIVEDDKNMPNVEKKLKAVIVINTGKGDKTADLASMVAVANAPKLPTTSLDLVDLRKEVDCYNSNVLEIPHHHVNKLPEANFVMTSSVFGSDKFNCEVEIKATDLKDTPEAAMSSPVDVYIERVLAKIRVNTNWSDGMTIKTGITYGKGTYDAVQLFSPDDRTKPIKVTRQVTDGETTTGKEYDLHVIFLGWCPQSVSQKSYLFKKVDSEWKLDWNWIPTGLHRCYWAVNPESAYPVKHYKHSDASGKIGSVRQNTLEGATTTTRYDGDFYYVQENAADNATDGTKIIYNPDKVVSNRTQVYLKAVLVTIDENNVATPIELAEWAGNKYTIDGLKVEMVEVVKNLIFTRVQNGEDDVLVYVEVDGQKYPAFKETEDITDEKQYIYKKDGKGYYANGVNTEYTGDLNKLIPVTNGKTPHYEYTSITPEMVEIKTATAVEEANDGFENSPRYLCFVQLKKDYMKDDIFFDAQHNAMKADDVNAKLKSMPEAKVWKGGDTYYYTDLVHEATAEDDRGKYGVVRNHIYDVEINTVYGLGTPVFTPVTDKGDPDEEIIIPQKPNTTYNYLGARINILSWRVVHQDNVTLDWD